MSARMSDQLQHDIFAHVEATFPNEGGGFLFGHQQASVTEVVDVAHIENVFATEEQYHRYAMTPQNWAQMEDAADAKGLVLIGYHHSHPDSPAIPSEYDRAHALPNFLYIITSVERNKAVDMRAWQLRPDRSQFDAVSLIITP
jgi:proteasome lid subunit RPN8/RPN11